MSIHIPNELRIPIPDCANETFVWYRSMTSPPDSIQDRIIGKIDCVWAMNIDGTIHMVEANEVKWAPEQWPFWCPISRELHKTCLFKSEYEIVQAFDWHRVQFKGTDHWIASFKDKQDALDFIEMKKAKS